MKKRIIGIGAALILAAAPAAWAQEVSTASPYTLTTFHRVHLRNGNTLEGDLIAQSDTSVVLKQPWGEILVRRDQINRVEFVKMKSFRDPEELVAQLPKVSSKAVAEIASASQTPSTPPAHVGDSSEPVPAGISKDIVVAVDQAINLWKTSVGAERQDLAAQLQGLGKGAVPYLEFLAEKRSGSTPLGPVLEADSALSEEGFIEFSKRALASANPDLREAAILALGKTNSPNRLTVLLKAMDDTNPSVWKPATEALLAAAKQDTDKRDLVDAIASNLKRAKNKTPFAIVLARIGDSKAHDLLWDMVSDSDETTQLTGLHGLGLMANPDDGARLLSLLRDPSGMVKRAVCLVLGKMKYAPAVGDLVGILTDNDPGLSKNARWALTEITGQVVSDTNEAWTEWWQIAGSKTDRFRR